MSDLMERPGDAWAGSQAGARPSRPAGFGEVMVAVLRALGSLGVPGVWGWTLAPAGVALVVWALLAYWGFSPLGNFFLGLPPLSWMVGWGWETLPRVLAAIGAWLALLAAAYLTATVLAGVVVMPALLRLIAARQYPDVAQLGEDRFLPALWNSLSAALGFVGGWLITLPLWIIPGMALVLPAYWLAWLNRRTFAYDALAVHATPEEATRLQGRYGRAWLMLGFIPALVAHIPLVGLLAPTLAALAYIHMALDSLRGERGGALMTGEAVRVVE